MTNRFLRIFAVMAAFVAALTSQAADDVISYDGFTFAIYKTASYGSDDYPNQRGDNVWFSGAVLVNTNGKTGEIVVPSHVPYQGTDYPVVGISGNDDTFYGHSGITKITIPGTVRLCENNSLRELEDLKELVFEDGEEDLWMGYSPGDICDDEVTYGSDNLNKVTIGRDMIWYTDEDEPFEDKHNLRTVVFTKGCKHIGIPGIDDTNRSLFNSCPDIETFTFEDSDTPLYVEYYGLYTKDYLAGRHQWKNIYIGRDIQYPGWDKADNTADGDGYSPFFKLGNSSATVTIGEKVTRLGSYMFYDSDMAKIDCQAEVVSLNNFALGEGDHSDGLYFNTVVLDQENYTGGVFAKATATKIIIKPSCLSVTRDQYLEVHNFISAKVDSVLIEPSDKAITFDPSEFSDFDIKHLLCYRSIAASDDDLYCYLSISDEAVFDDKCTKIADNFFSFIGIQYSPVFRIGKSVKEIGTINPGLFLPGFDPEWDDAETEIKEYYKDMKVPTLIFEAESIETLPQITMDHILWDGTNKYTVLYKFTGFMEQVPVYFNEAIDPTQLDKNKWNCVNIYPWTPTGIESVDIDVENEDINSEISDNRLSGIYTLSGVRLEKPQKGINIINGKKVIIR